MRFWIPNLAVSVVFFAAIYMYEVINPALYLLIGAYYGVVAVGGAVAWSLGQSELFK